MAIRQRRGKKPENFKDEDRLSRRGGKKGPVSKRKRNGDEASPPAGTNRKRVKARGSDSNGGVGGEMLAVAIWMKRVMVGQCQRR